MVRRAILVAALGVALSGCNTAYNYFEEEEPAQKAPQPTTAFGALLTMGGLGQQRAPEPDQPRAPLAIPGSTDLPPPETGSSVETAVNFPEDHDVRANRIASERASAAQEFDENIERRERALPGEIPGDVQVARQEEDALEKREMSFRDPFGRLTRAQMKQTIVGRKSDGLITEDGKPTPRTSLIQPPSSYRTPAETAALPEKGDIENSQWLRKRLYSKDGDPAAARSIRSQ